LLGATGVVPVLAHALLAALGWAGTCGGFNYFSAPKWFHC
jgi:hypothetical protein